MIGRYPPRYIALSRDDMHTIIIGLNFRGVRYASVINDNGEYIGLIRLLEVAKKIHEAYKEKSLQNLKNMKAMDIMDSSVPPISFDTISLYKIIEIMKKYDVGGISIIDKDKKVIGEVTEKHITDLMNYAEPVNIEVKTIMTKNPITIKADALLHEALDIMITKCIRRLPITYQEELVGILTLRDVIKYFSVKIEENKKLINTDLEIQLWSIASPRPITISEKDDIVKAIRLLRSEGVGSLLVTDEEGYLTGILTERDLLSRLPSQIEANRIFSLIQAYTHYSGHKL